jgi:hypothetical protein
MSTADSAVDQRSARRAYVPRHAARDVAEVEPSAPEPSGVELLPDQDLADNPPGQAVRAWAREARDEAPVRTFIARVAGIKTDERNRRVGGDGEVQVGRKLARLGKEWRVLHSVPVGSRGSDIDHIVIGPGGVFTINTKHHPDANVWVHGTTVKVNGASHRYARDSRYEAERAGQLLSARTLFDVGVRGVVAVVGARVLTVKAQPHDGLVTVVSAKELVAHLRAMPTRLDAASAERIYQVARHLATWQPDTVMWSDFA